MSGPGRWINGPTDQDGLDREDVERAGRLLANVEEPRARTGASQRVFRKLEASRGVPERRVWAWALSGAIAGAFAMFIMIRSAVVVDNVGRSRPNASIASTEIATIDGEAEALDASGAHTQARAGKTLRAGDRLRTGLHGTLSLSIAEGDPSGYAGAFGGLTMAPATELAVSMPSDSERGLEVELINGTVIGLARAEARSSVRVAIVSGAWRVSAQSARFEVRRAGDDLAIEVGEGSAEVRGPDGTRTLEAGAHVAVSLRVASAEPAVEREPQGAPPLAAYDSQALPRNVRRTANDDHAQANAAEAQVAKNDRVRRTLDRATKRIGRADRGDEDAASDARRVRGAVDGDGEHAPRTSVDEPRGSRTADTHRDGESAARTDADAARGSRGDATDGDGEHAAHTGANSTDPAAAARSGASSADANPARAASAPADAAHAPRDNATPAIPAAPAEDESTHLYNLARAERDPSRAIALYDRVTARGGSFAEIGAMQAARLVMNAGRCTEAIDRSRALIDRKGAYVQEAMLNVLECRIKLGALDAAGGDLEAFLLEYPKSERSPELRFLRAELHRRRGEIEIAAKDYEASLGSRRDQDALFFLAWSKAKLGEDEAARALLGEYLGRYPSKIHAPEARKLLERLDRSRKK